MLAKFGSWNLALGVEWRMPTDAREARALRKRRRGQSVVTTKGDGQQWLGFHEPCHGTVFAGALLIASVKRDAVVFFEQGQASDAAGRQAWICAIKNGVPVAGCDKVLPIDAARIEITNWLETQFPQAQLIGDLPQAKSSLQEVLELLAEQTPSQRRALRAAALSNPGAFRRQVAVAATCAVAFGGLLFAWHTHKSNPAPAGGAVVAQAPAPTPAQLQARANQDEERRKAEAIANAITEFRNRVSPVGMWDAVTQARRSLPLSEHGFRPRTMECTATECRIEWQGQGRSTMAADRAYLPHVVPADGADLSAVSLLPLEVAHGLVPDSGADDAEQLRLMLATQLMPRMRGFQFTPTAAPVQQPKAAPQGSPATFVGPVGTWQLTLSSPASLVDSRAVLERLSAWPVRVTKVRFSYQDLAVEISGDVVWVPPRRKEEHRAV